MSARKARRRPKKTTAPAAPPLAERLQAKRKQLFKAMSVIACCRLACKSMLEDYDPEDMEDALQVAHELIDQAADELGVMCGEDEQRRDDVAHRGEQS